MNKFKAVAVGMFAVALMSGCATPKIDSGRFAKPRTVAIAEFPDVKPAAIIGIYVANWPQFYYSPQIDPFFAPAGGQFSALPGVRTSMVTGAVAGGVAGYSLARANNTSTAQGVAGGAVVGLAVGALIDAGARATQLKAEGFPALMENTMPGLNMRAELMRALTTSLQQKGITVTTLPDSRNMAPRLRWPAVDEKGNALLTGPLVNSAPVDADIVVQIVPMVTYVSPGPLNNYNSVVGIGLAMYEGRTRKFIGWQAFKSDENKLWYARYDSLVADIAEAGPAQYSALISLVPSVADAISGDQK